MGDRTDVTDTTNMNMPDLMEVDSDGGKEEEEELAAMEGMREGGQGE